MITTFADVESLAAAWLSTSAVAPLVTRPGGGVNIFKAMPASSPLPAVIVSRVGGAPAARSDFPRDVARVSFSCWAASRPAATTIAITLVAELDNLARLGPYLGADNARLGAAEVLSWLWLPDPAADTPRYAIDALMTAIPG